VEIGMNYQELKKFKDLTMKDITAPKVQLKMEPKTITEAFLANTLPQDEGFIIDKMYENEEDKIIEAEDNS
jgi:hypothetical protein